jgi:ribosomal protein S18 acetylase RimI-like enzyme
MSGTQTDPYIDVHIRDAVESDAESLSSFAATMFRETYRPTASRTGLETYIARHFRADIQAAEIAAPDERTLVAERAGELVGYAQLRTGAAPECVHAGSGAAGAAIEIRRFYVASRWHGHGIAQRLMSACLQGGARGLPVWLGVFANNARAIAFYKKCGFRVAGDATFYMGETPEQDYVMVWNERWSARESSNVESRE